MYLLQFFFSPIQFSSVTQSCLTLCDSMNRSTPSLPVHHQLPESTQTRVPWVGDTIQPSHPLLSPSPALNVSQHQGLFKWVSSSHQVAKVLEFLPSKYMQPPTTSWLVRRYTLGHTTILFPLDTAVVPYSSHFPWSSIDYSQNCNRIHFGNIYKISLPLHSKIFKGSQPEQKPTSS